MDSTNLTYQPSTIRTENATSTSLGSFSLMSSSMSRDRSLSEDYDVTSRVSSSENSATGWSTGFSSSEAAVSWSLASATLVNAENGSRLDWNELMTCSPAVSGFPDDEISIIPETLSLNELYSIYRPAIAIVDRYMTPVWYGVGVPGNLISFAIWTRPRMRPSSGCYLAALAASDFLFLLLHFVFELHAAWDVPTLKAPFICEAFPVFFLALQYLSPLLVLAFTVERYISICHPFQRERYCTTRRALLVIACLSMGTVTLHIVQAYFWHYDSDNDICDVRSQVADGVFWTVYSCITELMAFGLVPVAILVLNTRVIAETRRMTANEQRLMGISGSGCGGGQTGGISGPSATTVMLLAVSFYLIVTTLPATVVYTVYFSFPPGNATVDVTSDVTWQRHLNYYTAKMIIQEVCMSHYAGNFFIYLMTGKIFRSELRRLLGRCYKHRTDESLTQYRRHRVVGDSRPSGHLTSSSI